MSLLSLFDFTLFFTLLRSFFSSIFIYIRVFFCSSVCFTSTELLSSKKRGRLARRERTDLLFSLAESLGACLVHERCDVCLPQAIEIWMLYTHKRWRRWRWRRLIFYSAEKVFRFLYVNTQKWFESARCDWTDRSNKMTNYDFWYAALRNEHHSKCAHIASHHKPNTWIIYQN